MTKFVFIKVTEIKNNDLWFKEKKFFRMDLNCLIDSASRMMLSNLSHSLTQKGKKRMLKAFSSAGKFL